MAQNKVYIESKDEESIYFTPSDSTEQILLVSGGSDSPSYSAYLFQNGGAQDYIDISFSGDQMSVMKYNGGTSGAYAAYIIYDETDYPGNDGPTDSMNDGNCAFLTVNIQDSTPGPGPGPGTTETWRIVFGSNSSTNTTFDAADYGNYDDVHFTVEKSTDGGSTWSTDTGTDSTDISIEIISQSGGGNDYIQLGAIQDSPGAGEFAARIWYRETTSYPIYQNTNDVFRASIEVSLSGNSNVSSGLIIAQINADFEIKELTLSGPSTWNVGSSIDSNNFTVGARTRLSTESSWTSANVPSNLSWNPSLPHTENTAGNVEFTVSSSGSGFASASHTVAFELPGYLRFADGSYSDTVYDFEESLDYNESINTLLSVESNVSWSISNNNVNTYGISVSKEDSTTINVSGTSTWDDSDEDKELTWTVSSSYTSDTLTITIVLLKTGGSGPSTDYRIDIVSGDNDIIFNASESSSETLTYSTNLPEVIDFQYDTVGSDIWNYVTVNVQSSLNRVTITYNGNYTGTSNISSGFYIGNWTDENHNNSVGARIDVQIQAISAQTQWFFDSILFDDLSCDIGDTIPSGTSVSGTYREIQKESYDGTTWTETGASDTHNITGSTTSSFTATSLSGGTVNASATCGSYGSQSGTADVNVSNPYTLEIYDYPSNPVDYDDQDSIDEGDFKLRVKKNGSVVSDNISGNNSNCNWSVQSSAHGAFEFGDVNDTESAITIVFYATYDYSVNSSATIELQDNVQLTYEPNATIDYEYALTAELDTNYGSEYVSAGQQLASNWFNVYWARRPLGTSGSFETFGSNIFSDATYDPSNLTVPSNASEGDTFTVTVSDDTYSTNEPWPEIEFTVYVPDPYSIEFSKNSITFTENSTSDSAYVRTYTDGSMANWGDLLSVVSANSNKVVVSKGSYSSSNGTEISISLANGYTITSSEQVIITASGNNKSTTLTVYLEPQDIDQYSITSSVAVELKSTNSYTNTFSITTYTNNSPTNWGSALGNPTGVDTSKISVTRQTYSNGVATYQVTKKSSYSPTTGATTSFTISGNGETCTVTISFILPPASSTVTFDDETGTISAGSTKYFYVSFTPTGSNSDSGVNYSLSSTSYATINSSWQGLTTGRGYVIVKNNSRTIQERTVTLTATHKLNSSVSDTVEITLLPPSFIVEFEYWYDAPCAYGEIASGELTVRGAVGEQFTLTITNNSISDGFTYGFRNGNSYSTTYSGTIGSSGYTTVDVYEYTKGENAEDSYSTSKITGVSTGNPSRTDYCMVARRQISASMSMGATPDRFSYTGGNCTFSLSSSGYNDTSFELVEYSDGAAMIENSASYIGTKVDYPGTLSVHITENAAVTSRRLTVRFRVRGTEYGDDYETDYIKEVSLTQSGRAPEQVIIVNPSSLTFEPTANGPSVAQMVTISSGDYGWNIVGNLPDWLAIVDNKTSGVSGDTISIYPTSQSGVNTRSASITFQATGGTITGSLTILQTENERILGFGHADDSVSKGWNIADEDFTGLSKYNDEHGWSYNASTRTLTINIPAESPKTLGTSQTATVNALYKVISRFIGWDMKVEGEAPTWLRVSPTSKFYDPTKTNTESTNINVVADDYNFQIDSSCYDQPRTAKYVINSNLKKNQ